MPAIPNPYQTGASPGGRPLFAGRAGVIAAVRQLLEPGQAGVFILSGPRGIGKSALLQQLAVRLPEAALCRTAIFDPAERGGSSLPDLVLSLATVIAARLSLPAPLLGLDVEQTFRQQWLPSALASIPGGAPLLLLVDEFPGSSLSPTAKSFYGWLRGLTDRNRRVRAVIAAGRRIDDEAWLAGNGFRGAPFIRLGMLDPEELEALVRHTELDASLSRRADVLERVSTLSGGHPLLARLLCSQVFDRAAGQKRGATPELVEAAAGAALAGSQVALEALWEGLSEGARAVTAVVAEVGAGAVPLAEVGQRLRAAGLEGAISGLETAGAELRDGEILERVGSGLQFRSELFRRYVTAHKPPARVLEEMGHGDQAAQQLFRAAQALHDRGSSAEAVSLLEKALELAPLHLPATALLGDALREAGRLEEARAVLEPLFQRHPSAARSRLIEVLEALAERTPGEEERLALLERALELDPHHRPALLAVQSTWLERGSRARKRGRLQEALEAFRKADRGDLAREVSRELRLRELEARMEPVFTLEAEERYGEQLELIKQLAREFEDVQDWSSQVERVKRRVRQQDLYRRALEALSGGERRQAIGLLEQVVAIEPGFKDAARLLQEALRQEGGGLAGGLSGIDHSSRLESDNPPIVPPPPAMGATAAPIVGSIGDAAALRLIYPPGETGGGEPARSGPEQTASSGSGPVVREPEQPAARAVTAAAAEDEPPARKGWRRWVLVAAGLLNLTPLAWWLAASSPSRPIEPEVAARGLVTPAPTPPGPPEDAAEPTPLPERLRPASIPPEKADRSTPIILLQKECEGGDMSSCFSLAWAYHNGTSTRRDERRAAQLFQRACDHGDGASCNSLAIQYQTGAGVPREPRKAVSLYQRACDDGEVSACRNLGLLYQTGEGATRDARRASSLFRQACTGQRVEGCTNLGLLYEEGQGVAKDRKKALQLFRQACDGKDLYGCQELAARYASGRGVAKDLEQARALYQRACDGGRREACEESRRLEAEAAGPAPR